jgi:hypothetical protein
VDAACLLVSSGLDGLQKLLNRERDPKRVALLTARQEEYSAWLRQLQRPRPQGPPLASGPAQAAAPAAESHVPLFFPDGKLPCAAFLANVSCPNPRCKLAHHETGLTRRAASSKRQWQ